jgi:hypothetical protein
MIEENLPDEDLETVVSFLDAFIKSRRFEELFHSELPEKRCVNDHFYSSCLQRRRSLCSGMPGNRGSESRRDY